MSGRPPRLAVLGLSHETNTFCLHPTDLEAFEREGILRGEQIWATHATAHTTLSGFWRAGQRLGVELVPLVYAAAVPSGMIVRRTFETLVEEMVARVREEGPFDGVLLAQHGAAVAEGFPDADGEVISRIRSAVGPEVPIGVVLDMHANVSPLMVDSASVTVVYRTNPHVDPGVRGEECAELVQRAILREVRPIQVLEPLPLVIDITRQATAESPMRELMADVGDVLRRPGILSASLAEGYPYADVPEMGMSCLIVADADAGLGQEAATWLSERVWSRREEMRGIAQAPDEALRAAAALRPGPALVLDVGDNIGGGGPGDSTVLLEAAMRLGIRGVLVILVDPDAVVSCQSSGPGGRVALDVGGRIDRRSCRPVGIAGRVRTLTDGRYEEPTATHGGIRFFDAGPTAVVETDDGNTVVLASRAVMPTSLEQLRALGLRPEDYAILTAKGVVSPRAGYERVTTGTFVADTRGVTAADVRTLPYAHRRRPLYPFEATMSWSARGP